MLNIIEGVTQPVPAIIYQVVTLQTATAEWTAGRLSSRQYPGLRPAARVSAGQPRDQGYFTRNKDVLYSRIPLKTIPVKPPALPQGRSRQKMVADIIRQPAGRSQSVPARPPFTSFSLPATPSPTKKCEFGLA